MYTIFKNIDYLCHQITNKRIMKRKLVTTLFIIIASLTCQAQHVINVDIPAAGTDATRLLQAAIDSAATFNGKPTVIRLANAQYDISRKESTPLLIHVSNTTSIDENPDATKHIGLYFHNLRNVTLDGAGARLITHGEMTSFVIDNCRNIKLQNFTLDAYDPSLAEATVMEVGDDYAILRCAKDTRYEIEEDGKLYWTGVDWRFTGGIAQVYDPERNTSLRTASPMDGLLKTEELERGLLKLYYASRPQMKIGTTYQMRHSLRTEVCGLVNRSKDTMLRNLNLNFLGNFGIVGQFSENLTYDNLRFAPAEDSDRTGAGFADFIQMSGCRGKIKITNSHFEGAHDDPINVHGTHLKVVKIEDERTALVRFMHHQTYGFDAFFPNDEVEFVSAHSLLCLQSMKVKSTEKIDDYTWRITFNKTINEKVKAEDNVALENVTWTPSVEIRNNYFSRIPTRGILMTTRRKVVIEDNTFFRIPMPSILISDDARSWYESGPVHKAMIRNNRFIECSSPVIDIWPEIDRYEGDVHKNITIRDNTFISCEQDESKMIRQRATRNLKISNN